MEHQRIDLMINEKCNIKCKFCYHFGFEKREYDFSNKKIDDTIHEWVEKEYSEVYISWWEPTISPNLIYSLEQLKKHPNFKKIKIMTNWLRFSDESFCQKLAKLWVTNLAISMHGYNEAIYEYHADVKWTYYKFIAGVRNARKYFDVEINSVITNKNVSSLPLLWILLTKLGIQKIHLQHVVPNSPAWQKLCLKDEDIKKYVNTFLELYSDTLDITLEFFPYCLIEEKHHKRLGKFSFKNDFSSNNDIMFDNWSDGILKSKVLRETCMSCTFKNSCRGFWY